MEEEKSRVMTVARATWLSSGWGSSGQVQLWPVGQSAFHELFLVSRGVL